MKKLRVAQLQTKVGKNKLENLSAAERMLKSLKGQNIDFAALPEMFCCPYDTSAFEAYAEEEGGALWRRCSDIARENHIYLSAGSVPERDGCGRIFNTAYVFDREGRQIAKHRKMHLFDIDIKGGQYFKESDTLTAGDAVTVFDTEFGLFGLCVCYDFRFPELGRLMADMGAIAVLVPASFNMTTGPAHWELMFRSQAVNNQFYAIGTAGARDDDAEYVSWGHSIVTDPWGTVVSQLDGECAAAVVQLELERVDEVRSQLPLLKHRRSDIYTLEKRESGHAEFQTDTVL